MQTAAQKPFLPSDLRPNSSSLSRAAYATFRGSGRDNVERLCGELFPADQATLAIVRAATPGATTTQTGWAAELVSASLTAWLASLGPAAAGGTLIARGVQVEIDRNGFPVQVPVLAASPAVAPWVAEDAPIPFGSFPMTTVELTPRKLGVLVALTKELNRRGGGQQVFDRILRQVAAISLDAALFSDDDGSAPGHHPGLLAGLVPLAGSDDMVADLTALAAAVSGDGASGEIIYIGSTARGAAVALRSAEITATFLGSSAVPADRVVAVDPKAILFGMNGVPEIDASEMPTLHMSDSPQPIATVGAPNVVAAPVQSMFQTAQIALRMLLDIAFAPARPNAVAYADGCVW